MLKLDIHVHTVFSGDAITRPREAVLCARRAGLDGLAITDHETLRGAELATKLARSRGVLVIPGIEIEGPSGHVLALGVLEPMGGSENLTEVRELIKGASSVSVLAHPFRLFTLRRWDPSALTNIDAIEVVNAKEPLFEFSTWMARKLARSIGKPETGGSDAHIPDEIGTAYTLVDAEPDVDDVLEAVRKGKMRPEGRRTPLRYIIKRWSLVGLRSFRLSPRLSSLPPPELLV